MEELLAAFHRGIEAMQAGDYPRALSEFVWVHDNPSLGDLSSECVRRAYCFSAWAGFGNIYQPARDKMVEILAEKQKLAQIDLQNRHLAADIRAMQQALSFADTIADDTSAAS
jgi:hypothetical protein